MTVGRTSSGSPPTIATGPNPWPQADAHADVRPHADFLRVLEHQIQLAVPLDHWDDLAAHLLRQHRHLDEFEILEAVADDWRVVVGHRRHGEELRLAAGLEAEAVLRDIPGARAALETTISLALSLQAPFWENWARAHLGVVDLLAGSVERARLDLDNALNKAAELQSVYGVAIAAWCEGQARCAVGDAAGAEATILRGSPLQRMTGLVG